MTDEKANELISLRYALSGGAIYSASHAPLLLDGYDPFFGWEILLRKDKVHTMGMSACCEGMVTAWEREFKPIAVDLLDSEIWVYIEVRKDGTEQSQIELEGKLEAWLGKLKHEWKQIDQTL